VHGVSTLTSGIDTGIDTLKNSGKHTLCGIICMIISKCIKANELLDHLKYRRVDNTELKKEEMNNLLKDTHKEEKEIRSNEAKKKEK
jgi:hypothetical protein